MSRNLRERWSKNPGIDLLNSHLVDYPSPANLGYIWGIGSSAGLCLGIQIFTGIFLAIHYSSHVDLAFASVEHIIRDVNNGWLLRYIHANGASMFFIAVYLHLFKNIYYGSFKEPREHLWVSGVLIFFLIVLTAFIGYVLPWGQISFWGATVITNLVSAVPFVGPSIVQWLWGGFAVGNATLNRFFSLHYLFPFVILGLVIGHLILLHQTGNNNPIGNNSDIDKIPFYPYCYVKDLFVFFIFSLFFSYIVFFFPNELGHPDNYIPANSLVTPPHIVPEWYLLPFYAILRSIPDKLGGVLTIGGAIAILATIPFTSGGNIRSMRFSPLHKVFFWFFVMDSLVLLWIGQNVVEYPFIEIGQLATAIYFFYFIFIIPFLGDLEYKYFLKI